MSKQLVLCHFRAHLRGRQQALNRIALQSYNFFLTYANIFTKKITTPVIFLFPLLPFLRHFRHSRHFWHYYPSIFRHQPQSVWPSTHRKAVTLDIWRFQTAKPSRYFSKSRSADSISTRFYLCSGCLLSSFFSPAGCLVFSFTTLCSVSLSLWEGWGEVSLYHHERIMRRSP